MAYNKHDDIFIMPQVVGRHEGFWKARDAISRFIFKPYDANSCINTGDRSIDALVDDCKELPEVKQFIELGTTPMLERLYKYWVNDAISSALKTYINQRQ